MRMKKTLTIFLLLITSWAAHISGQEVRGLNINPNVRFASVAPMLKNAGTDTIPRPPGTIFFDDFTNYGDQIFPNTKNNWLDNHATITLTYADSAISFGVVTLDCFDSMGDVHGPVNRTNPSDTLTSRYITSITESSLYLSFFIQGGGKVDPPELQDELILEFKDTKDSTWFVAWRTPGFDSTQFKQIIIPVHDSLVADSSFQFRFINYTSLSANQVQGKDGALSNADNWHIDYIQLKSAADSIEMTLLNDAAIFEPLNPVFEFYNLIPYQHIQYASSYLLGRNTISYRTIFPEQTENISVQRAHIYQDVINNITLEAQGISGGIQSTVSPNAVLSETDIFRIQYQTEDYPDQEYGEYDLSAYIQVPTEINQYPYNDTVVRKEIYQDYYAYDDGIAEFGFGIAGADAFQTAFATQFENYSISDTLTGVYIYFNQAADENNADLEFQVAVWNNISNSTGQSDSIGDTLFTTDEFQLYTPEFNNGFNNPRTSTNGFMRIDFERELIVPELFYIGIIQYTTEFLNVGYDLSLNTKPKLWFYTDNAWNQATNLSSIPEGALMIRPIFGNYNFSTNISPEAIISALDFQLYPNPATHHFKIQTDNYLTTSYKYAVYDLSGRLLLTDAVSQAAVDISHLSEGIYMVSITHQSTKQVITKKLLKTN